MPSSLAIAQAATPRPIEDVAADLGLPEEVEPYGRFKAKIDLSVLDRLADRPDGKLVCVTAITPTARGEGKTTTAVGLAQGLARLDADPVLCLREASLGPVFGIKGDAAGGGYAQVLPMEDLNLHFTGDPHAIGAANNLLAALVDAHVHHGNGLGLEPSSITWQRCLDMNDRALGQIVTGLGGHVNGVPRETGFDITAASEVMAIVAVGRDLRDLRRRLGAITVGRAADGSRITAEALGAAGAMAVLLQDTVKPNLVQTLEGRPALVHCGPFGNIASGTNSLVDDLVALKLGRVVVTESGFGSETGLEKLADIVCRAGGLEPAAAVLVATPQTLALHGSVNLERHLAIVRSFGLEPIVAVNKRPEDDDEAVEDARRTALEAGATVVEACDAFERGELDDPLEEKIAKVARLYGAAGIELAPAARATLEQLEREGLGALPVCMAKTHLSVSHDALLGATPNGFTLTVRDLRPYTGAGWVVALCGDMQTMPGLSADPAALVMDVDADGRTTGLF
jgi:formate--tetrahydrofolate ligase